jgi:hypothetical protein
MVGPIRPKSPSQTGSTESAKAADGGKKPSDFRMERPETPWQPKSWSDSQPMRDDDDFLPGPVDQRDPPAPAPSRYALVPGRYEKTTSLPDALVQTGHASNPAITDKVLARLQRLTGVDVAAQMPSATSTNATLTDLLEITPKQMSEAMSSRNQAYQAGAMHDIAKPKQLLPRTFDLANWGSVEISSRKNTLSEIAPDLLSGDVVSAVDDTQMRQNTVVAEVLQRLAGNANAPEGERFEVTYGGQSYKELDGFVKGLLADGYQVGVSFNQRIANIAALKQRFPESDPEEFLDVPAPIMLKTGIRDAHGNEAVVPAGHSEIVFAFRATDATRGPKLSADTTFLQGMEGTGFFPANGYEVPAWLGLSTSAALTQGRAAEALTYAGAFTDVVQAASKQLGLYADGYGVTGVCNDSVAVIEQALLGKTSAYPLLMQDEMVLPQLEQRIRNSEPEAAGRYRRLAQAIRELPSDAVPNETSQQRALASIPWAPGKEPFASTVEARRILEGQHYR